MENKIRAFRKAKGMSQTELSEKLGVPIVPVEIDGADLLCKIFEE